MQRFTDFDFGVSCVMALFHQDWMYNGPTAADLVAKHLAAEPVEEVLAVRRDAWTLLENLPSEALEVLWTAGAEYIPAFVGTTGSEWTRTVVGLCDAQLAARPDVRPLTGADTEDGFAHRDAVIAEIERVEFLSAEVRAALVGCARKCTPDLALRVLVRVVWNTPRQLLSADQYARLEAIGSALHYGEYVVDAVKFMVEQD
ncbi:contact-dependent growth inhibition system immunity protein [Streptomyces sp. NPDC048385]|uniref:contact-dependent growth inhibition system immunity protein n=1 Tax=unclassified Streptomyces TaxID=2593676 RepID=UPI0034281FFC